MSDSDMNRFILDKLEKVDEKVDEVRLNNARLKEAFDGHEKIDEEIHTSVKDMAKDMGQQMKKVCNSLDTYNELLKQHIRRTEIAEKNIEHLKTVVTPMAKEFHEKQILDQASDEQWKKRAKILGVVATALGIIVTALKLMDIF